MNMRKQTIFAVYGSGLLVGISLIIFPSAGPIFTDPTLHNLSPAQFGSLFTPQIITAILSASFTAWVSNRIGMKRVLQLGLLLSAVAMFFLAFSHFVIGSGSLPFIILLLATGAMGAGFGFTISALNAYAFSLFPGKEDSAVTAIHVVTGTGQVAAALLLNYFQGIGRWWIGPLIILGVTLVMVAYQSRLPLTFESGRTAARNGESNQQRLPSRVWLYAIVTFTYGAIEGTFGNWTPIYLEEGAGLSAGAAALGLSLFWGAVTVGRVLFAIAAARYSTKFLFYVTPFVAGATLILIPLVDGQTANYILIILAGLGISFFFPYTVSLASAEYPAMTAAVSGSLVAGLQLGNGISANLTGFASQSIPLATIFQLSALYALIMAIVVIYLGRSGSTKSSLNEELPNLVLPCIQNESKQS